MTTLSQVLDFGAFRDGVPEYRLGKRILVDRFGLSVDNDDDEDDYDPTE
jgi:F-box and WD-40 domain protein CDC4